MVKNVKFGKVTRKRYEKDNCTDVTITNQNGVRFQFAFYDDGKVLLYNHYDVTEFQFAFGEYNIELMESDNPNCKGWSRPKVSVKTPL